MPSFYAKDSGVQNRQLKVQELCIPLAITGNATPASVVVASDEPAILFLKTEGKDQITAALGTDSASFVAPVDATGLFSALLVINEQVSKVLSAELISRVSHAPTNSAKLANANTGISTNGDKIAIDCDTAVDLSAANLNACLVVRYIVAE